MNTRVLAYVWASLWVSGSGVRAYGCVGVWVSLFCSYLCASACRTWVPACLPWVHAGLGCLYAYLDWKEFVAIFLFSSVRVDSVAQRIHVGSRIGHRIPKWKDLGPLSVDRRADGDVRRLGGLVRDERSDNSCWRKLRVLTPHESEDSCL